MAKPIIVIFLFFLPTVLLCQNLRLVRIAQGFKHPVGFEVIPGDKERHFIVEQKGHIRIVRKGVLQKKIFLDISEKANMKHSEQGLLGLAFHPKFKKNLRFYVHYTDRKGDTVISQYTAKSSDEADSSSEKVILAQKQPYSNHNGGQISFGPDGYLYIALGDGGSGGDPHYNGQDLGTWLGKILRIDVDGKFPYAVPRDNPFIKRPEAKAEIWAWGLRNPWRFSFDTSTNRVYIADVGQNKIEEINVEDLSEGGGKNYGWNVYEGNELYRKTVKVASQVVPPAAVYGHEKGRCSVTGGYVYRGKSIPWLNGTYFYADFCSGDVWSFSYGDNKPLVVKEWTSELTPNRRLAVSSFGRDDEGELYILNYEPGEIYKILPR